MQTKLFLRYAMMTAAYKAESPISGSSFVNYQIQEQVYVSKKTSKIYRIMKLPLQLSFPVNIIQSF